MQSRPSTDGILEAAERVFAAKGYGETSLRDLIAAANVSTSAFYSRFSSKEAVLEALAARLLGQMIRAASEAFASARGLEDAAGWGVDVLVAGLASHKPLLKVLLTEAMGAPSARPMLTRSYRLFVDLLSSILEPHPEIRDREGIAWSLVGTAQVHLTRWLVLEELDEAGVKGALRQSAYAMMSHFAEEAFVRRTSAPRKRKPIRRKRKTRRR